ncbi:MAG: hypothetical protein WC455_17000 [Dehalococcoidia bacterium]|jgi:hypothetical protein
MQIEKSCLFCSHFNFDMGSPDYSEYTPGSDACFSCYKNHWTEISNCGGDSIENFVKAIETAKTCEDFERRKPE